MLADFIHAKVCKLKCEKLLTLSWKGGDSHGMAPDPLMRFSKDPQSRMALGIFVVERKFRFCLRIMILGISGGEKN